MIDSKTLPIHEKRLEIETLLAHNQVLIIAGQTGSGKSTQLPQICYDCGYGNKGLIGVSQPRRIAATSLAQRVAFETSTQLGSFVGYRIRFSDQTSKDTRLVFMTDGMMLTDIHHDKLLQRYQTIIIDEAHERSLNIDFLIGYLKMISKERPDLKIIISSATIDIELFSKFFSHAPVVEVSGQLFPVDVFYQAPQTVENEDQNQGDYIDEAMIAVETIIDMGDSGDILVFMPTERDILEMTDRLNEKKYKNSTPLPLFGRMAQSSQDRIFQQTSKRKILVATNIAETSLTIPGIRFVIDTGLSRFNRYIPHLRTNRLPIEPISRASADQRKGRCGRVADGICIRLYEEEDYLKRRAFTEPEIQRSNLAGVVLSMLHIGIKDVEAFPFLEPPAKTLLRAGIMQLQELGALTKETTLTPLGKKMAALGLEPHMSRMVLEAMNEDVVREVAIIAAGLSIVDPRQRPIEEQQQADTKHRDFLDPSSDFLSLLRLWDVYHLQWKQLKRLSALKKFCKEHFLSLSRMQEWHDVHSQILSILKHPPLEASRNLDKDRTQAIHRSICAGIITNIAKREEKSAYLSTRNRELFIFPGSVLFRTNPEWVMCHEIVETSRVFGRTVAPIDPAWIETLAPHLCKTTVGEPYFDKKQASVFCTQTKLFFGLPIVNNRRISYRIVDPHRACEIFCSEGLVADGIDSSKAGFLQHNRNLYQQLKANEIKLREQGYITDEHFMVEFYVQKLQTVCSFDELRTWIRKRGSDKELWMEEKHLLMKQFPESIELFPDTLHIGSDLFQVMYTFDPASKHDGVTLLVPHKKIPLISENVIQWVVPGLWEKKIASLLQSLPKEMRKDFIPFSEYGYEISRNMKCESESFYEELSRNIKLLYGKEIAPSLFEEIQLPEYLLLTISVIDDAGATIVSGKNLSRIKSTLSGYHTPSLKHDNSVTSLEKYGLHSWDIQGMDECITIKAQGTGYPLILYPAFCPASTNTVDYKLFTSKSESESHHRNGIRILLENELASECAWLEFALKFSHSAQIACAPLGGKEKVKKAICKLVFHSLLMIPEPLPRLQSQFAALVMERKKTIKALKDSVIQLVETILPLIGENFRLIDTKQTGANKIFMHGLAIQLKTMQKQYFEDIFSLHCSIDLLKNYPRYFLSLRSLIEKVLYDSAAAKKRIASQEQFETVNRNLKARLADSTLNYRVYRMIHECIETIEEFKISIFAQQKIGTLFPVSEKRILQKIEELRQEGVLV